MSQVTIPTTLGGSGISYSDDGTGARDMRDGGHRQWLLPMVGEQIAAAQTAVTAAASTVGAASTQASSTTSLTIGTGTQSLTVETGKNIIPGMPVRIASQVTPSNRMDGTVVSYNSGTGALVVSVDRVNGSGSESGWRVFLTGAGISTSELLDAEFGGAGPTITTPTALTAASARVRPVAMTAVNQAVTLPNATTLQLGGPQFVLPNTGSFPVPVRDTSDNLITVIDPGGLAELHLLSNVSSAGAWVATGRGLSSALSVVDFTWESTWTQTVDVTCRLSAAVSLHFARNASGHPAIRAVNHVTGQIGNAVLISAVNQTVVAAFRISDTKAFIVIDGNTSNLFNVAVDASTLVVTPSANATGAVFDAATYTGAPFIAQIGANGDVFVAVDQFGGNVRAQVVDASGTAPNAGSPANVITGAGVCGPAAVYRTEDTRVVVIMADGATLSNLNIRAAVLTTSGVTFAVGTVQTLAAGVANLTDMPTVQLTTGSHIVYWYRQASNQMEAAHIGVSGTTVTIGAAFVVETSFGGNTGYTALNSNRFQPLLSRQSDTTALMTYGDGSSAVRHVVLSNSGGTLSRGTIMYGLWSGSEGGNLPQGADSFIAINAAQNVAMLYGVSISGTSLSINGTTTPPGQLGMDPGSSTRFGLSGGVQGVLALGNQSASRFLMGNARILLYRSRAGGGPIFLGQVSPPNTGASNFRIPVEVAPSKASFTYESRAQNGSTTAAVKLAILEFAA